MPARHTRSTRCLQVSERCIETVNCNCRHTHTPPMVNTAHRILIVRA